MIFYLLGVCITLVIGLCALYVKYKEYEPITLGDIYFCIGFIAVSWIGVVAILVVLLKIYSNKIILQRKLR